jgi:hypothetical protein
MLQDTWQEERITHDLNEKLNNKIRLIISVNRDESFALGSVRECSPSGKQGNIISFTEELLLVLINCMCN